MVKKYLFILICILIAAPLYGHTWTNAGGDHLWRNSFNWDLLSVPSSSDEVWITGQYPYCEIDSAASAQSAFLYINPAAAGVTAPGFLQISGGVFNPEKLIIGDIAGMTDFAKIEMSGGTLTHGDRFLIIADTAGSKGWFDMSGSASFAIAKRSNIGQSGYGKLTLRGNAYFYSSGAFYVGNKAGAQGYLSVEDNAYLELDNNTLNIGLVTTGHVDLLGGKITTPGISMGPSMYATLNVAGGILEMPGDKTAEAQPLIDSGQIYTTIPGYRVIADYDAAAGLTTLDVEPIPTTAYCPFPGDGMGRIPLDVLLGWQGGSYALTHDLLLGTDSNLVQNAQRTVGDINGDGFVNYYDTDLLAALWLTSAAGSQPYTDLTGDDFVSVPDIKRLAQNWLSPKNPAFMGNLPTAQYNALNLEPGETYYWRVDEINSDQKWTGDIWSFTVTGQHPKQASNPSPPDFGEGTGTTGVALQWNPGQGAIEHDVYFGTDKAAVGSADTGTPGLYKGRQAGTSYPAGVLTGEQTYYWRIDEWDGSTLTTGHVWEFTAVDYTLAYGIEPPVHIYAVPFQGMDWDELITLTSLQGVIARTRPQLYLYKAGVNKIWLDEFYFSHNIGTTYVDEIIGAQTYIEWAIGQFGSYITGYILYDSASNPDSLNVASSLAGLYNAVIVDADYEPYIQSLGLNRVLDVRTRSNQWLDTNYGSQMNPKAIIVKNPDPASWYCTRLHDLSAALNCRILWDSDTSFTSSVYDSIEENTQCFGWGDGAYDDELAFVRYHANHNLVTKPSNGLLNLSTFMGMAEIEPRIEFEQVIRDNTYPSETNVHYVTFIHSDMDNITFTINGWAEDLERYGSPYRGDFPMGWGMSLSMVKVAPHVMKWYYDNATENDCFIAPFSGMGYIHPTDMPALDKYIAQTNRYMAEADITAVLISEPDGFAGGTTIANQYASMTSARGFFVTGNPYHEYGDDIRWYGGKPFISVKYSLWDGFESPSSLVSKINSRSTDVTREEAYTPVVLHAWSYTLDDIKYIVDRLDANVRVVTPEEMIEHVYTHGAN